MQLDLFDLWGFTEAERKQAVTGKKKKTSDKTAKKAGAKKSAPIQPKVQSTPKAVSPPPAIASPVPENKEAKQGNTIGQGNPEDVYAAINWEDNPPINGFYEMMMDLTPERRAELRQVAARHGEEQQKEIEAPQEAGQSEPAQETSAAASMLFPEPEKEQQQIEKEPDLSPCPYHRTPEMHLREGSLVEIGRASCRERV